MDVAEGAGLEESFGVGEREAPCPDEEQAEPKRIDTTAAALQLCFIISESSGLAPMWPHLYLD